MITYLALHKRSQLTRIRDRLIAKLARCELCPRKCKVNRLEGELGFCRTGRTARVSSYFFHFGEEPELVGRGGSGTIFFSNCNLGCVYCQNYDLSHLGEGNEVDAVGLAQMMLTLQKQGAENINFVTPTHTIAQIVEALCIAADEGLRLPLVYNCGGYESLATLKTIRGVFDIYMPDVKYANQKSALAFSGVCDYWAIVRRALLEMYKQVGDLVIQKSTAQRGLLIRHLVLPNHLADSFAILRFIAKKISKDTYVNIMQQYHPCFKAHDYEGLTRRLTLDEYLEVIEFAKEIGLSRGFRKRP